MATGIKFDVIEFLKLAPKYFLPILIFSGIIVFLPESWLEFLYLDTIILKYRWIASLLFILSLSMFIGGILIKAYDVLKNKIKNRKINKYVKNKLNNLSETQRTILLRFVEDDVKSISLPISNGEVADLESHLIIYRATGVSTDMGIEGPYFDYCLQPAAEKIISKNNYLIKKWQTNGRI